MDQEVLDLRPGKHLYPAQNLKDPLFPSLDGQEGANEHNCNALH